MSEISKPDYTYIWSSGGSLVAPSSVKIQTGWTAEVPPFQWENYVQNRQDQAIAHILQHGISVWDTVTEYQAGKSYVQGSDGLIYKAVGTNTNQNPITDTTRTYWNKDFTTGSLLNVQTFTSSGTYTPSPGMKSVVFEARGAGAGAGGIQSTSGTQFGVAGGAGGGAKAVGKFLAAAIGASKVVTVGVGGVGGSGAAGGDPGTNGGTTSVGVLISAAGGFGGLAGTVTTLTSNIAPGTQGGQTIVGGNILSEQGQAGGIGVYIGSSYRGGIGGGPAGNVGGVIGDTTSPAGGLGSGASGHAAAASSPARTGGVGGNGYVIAWEYS